MSAKQKMDKNLRVLIAFAVILILVFFLCVDGPKRTHARRTVPDICKNLPAKDMLECTTYIYGQNN